MPSGLWFSRSRRTPSSAGSTPKPAKYLSRFPEALQAFGGAAFSHGGAWRLGDFAAAALWLPPGIEPGGDANLALFQATVDSRKFTDLLGVFGQMEQAHPAMPHWYLPWFGVDCALQGQGACRRRPPADPGTGRRGRGHTGRVLVAEEHAELLGQQAEGAPA